MSANVTQFLDYVRKLVDKIPALKAKAQMVEDKAKVSFEKIVAFFVALMVLMVFVDFGANIICNLVGFIYPMIQTIVSIESTGKDDDTFWLTYWVVFGFFGVIEGFIDFVVFWIPFYFPLKLFFLLWCMLPDFRGAELVYKTLILPQFEKHEKQIESILDKKAAEKYSEGEVSSSSSSSAAGGSSGEGENKKDN